MKTLRLPQRRQFVVTCADIWRHIIYVELPLISTVERLGGDLRYGLDETVGPSRGIPEIRTHHQSGETPAVPFGEVPERIRHVDEERPVNRMEIVFIIYQRLCRNTRRLHRFFAGLDQLNKQPVPTGF